MAANLEKLKRYLLGDLESNEAEEFDLELIANEEFEHSLIAAEGDLIEDFLDGRLTAEEEALFAANFLTSDARRGDMDQIRLLRTFAPNYKKNDRATAINVRAPNVFPLFVHLLSLRRLFAAFCVVTIAVGAIWLGWRLISNQEETLSGSEREFAELNATDLTHLPDAGRYSNFVLVSGLTRDAAPIRKVLSAEMTERVFLRLPLPVQLALDEVLMLRVLKGAKTVFTQKALRIYQNQNGQELRVFLPKSALPNGRLQIIVSDLNRTKTPIIYELGVE